MVPSLWKGPLKRQANTISVELHRTDCFAVSKSLTIAAALGFCSPKVMWTSAINVRVGGLPAMTKQIGLDAKSDKPLLSDLWPHKDMTTDCPEQLTELRLEISIVQGIVLSLQNVEKADALLAPQTLSKFHCC